MVPEPGFFTSFPGWDTTLTFAGGVIVTLITTLAGGSIRRAKARQYSAEGSASLAEVTLKWATQLRDDLEKSRSETETRLNQMASRVSILERENELYRRHNRLLVEQVIGAGLTPVPQPVIPEPTRRSDDEF